MDKETARKAKDFLTRRDAVPFSKLGPNLDLPPETTPAHFTPRVWPPESFAQHYASIQTANKVREDEEEKNSQVPVSDIATHGSVAGDAQENAPKYKTLIFREEFERVSKELNAMDKKERDAMFPHHSKSFP